MLGFPIHLLLVLHGGRVSTLRAAGVVSPAQVQSAREATIDMVTPRIGDLIIAGQSFVSSAWWEDVQ